MDERQRAALDSLLQSKNYRDLCPATVERVFAEELRKHPRAKEADKAARARLHQIAGAFLAPAEIARADGLLGAHLQGDESALPAALRLHASTRERLPFADALFERAFERTGHPGLILDLACGLNPLHLGARGHSVIGYDIQTGANALINRWARACGWDARAETCDLLMSPPLPEARLALLLKLLPVLERQQKGAARALLESLPTRFALCSFPTRTLSGRSVGMAQNYARWFLSILPDRFDVVDEYECGPELCFLLEAKHG